MKAKLTSQAKRESYAKLIESGALNTKTLRVLNHIKIWGDSNQCDTDALRNSLNMPHQTITGILSNLLDIGIIKIVGENKVNNIPYSIYHYVSDTHEQKQLENTRRITKYAYYVKQGLKEYDTIMSEAMRQALEGEIEWANKWIRYE